MQIANTIYEAEAKLRPSNSILPEAQGSGSLLICTPLPWQQHKPYIIYSIMQCCNIRN